MEDTEDAAFNCSPVQVKYPTCRDVTILCAKCERILLPDKSCLDSTPHRSCWNDGTVDKIVPGYGSIHDQTVFLVGLCDCCLTIMSNKGTILRVTNLIEELYRQDRDYCGTTTQIEDTPANG